MDFLEDYWWILAVLLIIVGSISEKLDVISKKISKDGDKGTVDEKSADSPFSDPVPEGGWRCAYCGTPHHSYEYWCVCGANREKATAADSSISKKTTLEADAIKEIKKYKELFDEGIITQDEFDAKKKQLLDL